ncbi:MAG TPA: hypothetical protein GX708_13875 [Gallicola sp.]|nr:hypothetical protein [Gallicola sp.]
MDSIDKLNDLYEMVYDNKLDIIDVLNIMEDNGLMDDICKEVAKFEFYTLDGIFQNILDDLICKPGRKDLINFINFLDFIHLIENELKKIYVPIVIAFPINVLDSSKSFTSISFENNKINIFSNEKTGFRSLNEYVNKNVYMNFDINHILAVKDRYFDKSPIMTILVEGIEYSVRIEAPKIVESIYSILRIVNMYKSGGNSPYRFQPMGSTYVVYYNQPGTPKKGPYQNGYGYSFRFGFSNILDMSMNDIELNKIKISYLLNRLIEYTFYNKNLKSQKEIEKYGKWVNALILFNEAYELASIEKYDIANLLLLTILESFFNVKNKKGKKEVLKERISPIVINRFDDTISSKVIHHTYDNRNHFVHEGKRMRNRLKYRPINDTSGLVKGLEPINYANKTYQEDGHDLYYLSILFEIVIYCITDCYDEIASVYILQ